MKIVIIGTGYVGLVSGTCFAEIGNNVVCIDKNKLIIDNLNSGIITIHEPGLPEIVKKNMEEGRLNFSVSISENISNADVIFIAVGTPRGKEDGEADLSYVFEAAEEIASLLKDDTLVAIKSTVPVGTGRRVKKIISEVNSSIKVDFASVPEFLREGKAVEDFMNPDRVIVGCESEKAKLTLYDIHKSLLKSKSQFVSTTFETAELIKYAANAFLAVKISYINEIANLCEKVGANVEDVAHGVGLDSRIKRWGLSAGPGFGGSCFPKDTLALAHIAAENSSQLRIVESAITVNDSRKANVFSRVRDSLRGELRQKKIAVLGLTYKSDTDDLRDSPSLELIPRLIEYGANVSVFDPQGMNQAKKILNNIYWANDIYDAVKDADAAVIMTEWEEFGPKFLNLEKLKRNLKKPLLIDFRNLFDPDIVFDYGIEYVSVGRPSRLFN
ncbi:UDP-glucose/GDP-mannose dehydrogenase family protein [Alphaproteobacteria bacterium]|nr:UDP-glucose/GDP-mannose dehydrogenase family protein [Alphaproteobacteria bacterium]